MGLFIFKMLESDRYNICGSAGARQTDINEHTVTDKLRMGRPTLNTKQSNAIGTNHRKMW